MAKSKMSDPVTHEEFRAGLDELRVELRGEMAMWGGALNANIEVLRTEMREMRTEMREMRTEMRDTKIELSRDLSRHVRAIDEEHRADLKVVDEKYADLPDRVSALEKR
jgi:hypothetical protein